MDIDFRIKHMLRDAKGDPIPQYWDEELQRFMPLTVQNSGGEWGQRGDSLYEIAVRNGFTGTEAEWLLMVKGDKDG